MATIHCKACGAIYRYEKEGCCPKCGAYNRPPKRERVNADGTVQHMTDAAYEKRQHAQGKVCFEEKECHEEKVCYEDQARHGNRSTASASTGSTVYARPAESTVYAKPSQTPRTYNYTAPKPTGPAPHAKFPEKASAPVQSNSGAKQKKRLPIGCLIPLAFIGIEVLAAVIALIREVLSSLGL